MKTLHLELSSTIKGRFYIETKSIKNPFFMLNKSFFIHNVFCDNLPIHFQQDSIEYNYQKISFKLPEHNQILLIEYEGILDGTTGRWPYVKEKTTDELYLLRDETIYYPVFEIPYSETYFSLLLYPTEKEKIRVFITRKDSRHICSNLTCIKPFIYEGYNPTFVIGNLKKYKCSFGKIWLSKNDKRSIKEIEKIVMGTNQFMNHFKQAEIKHFQIISIPKGYGSFVLPGTMFFTQDANYQGLIHELIHINWNPPCQISQQKARFFDEGLTQYFTARVCDALSIQSQDNIMAQYLHNFKQQIHKWKKTPYPIEEFASHDCGELSYSFSALALQAIENRIGKETMDSCLSKMLTTYETDPIDFLHFKSFFPETIEDIYTDYFLTNNAANRLLKETPAQ